MQEAQRRSLVNLRWIRHMDGHLSGPYGQCWADAIDEDWHVFPGAEFRSRLMVRATCLFGC